MAVGLNCRCCRDRDLFRLCFSFLAAVAASCCGLLSVPGGGGLGEKNGQPGARFVLHRRCRKGHNSGATGTRTNEPPKGCRQVE